jgi:hypothetical protein
MTKAPQLCSEDTRIGGSNANCAGVS